MNQKGLAPIIIILVLVGITVLTGSAYYLGTRKSETLRDRLIKQNPEVVFPPIQPNPTNKPLASNDRPNMTDETANWKTYVNNKYAFSFKYPHALNLVEIDKANELNISFKKDLKESYVLFDLYVKPKDNKSMNPISNKIVTINNLSWEIFYPGGSCTGLTVCPQGIPYYQSIKNDFVYEFIYPDPKDEKELVDMLNTFKFLQ